MGWPIEDGRGTGNRARVNTEGQLEVLAVSIPEDRHINSEHEAVWSLPFEGIDPVAADDYFFYIQNTGSKNLGLTDFRISSTVAGTVEIHYVTGVPIFTAGVDVEPVSRFLGSNNDLGAIVKTDTDTTGLVNEGVLFYIDIDVAGKLEHLKTSSNIIIPPGQGIAMLWDQATGILKGVVSVVELQEP